MADNVVGHKRSLDDADGPQPKRQRPQCPMDVQDDIEVRYLIAFPSPSPESRPSDTSQIPASQGEQLFPQSNKMCRMCLKVMPTANFSKSSVNGDKLLHRCKQCDLALRKTHNNSERGRLQAMVVSSRGTTKKRKTRAGREGMCESELTIEHMQEILESQNRRCFYGGIEMSLISGQDWLVTRERLDPSIGYCLSNVVLVCAELNHMTQWSKSKIVSLLKEVTTSHDDGALQRALDTAILKPTPVPGQKRRKRRQTSVVEGIRHTQCDGCAVFKPNSSFVKLARECRDCGGDIPARKFSLRDFLLRRLSRAHERRPDGFSLTLEWACDQLKRQHGRCYYSNVPMRFANNVDWTCSIERLDQALGYTPDNAVFICWEFNTAISQWSATKFIFFLGHVRVKFAETDTHVAEK